jgi:DnaJ-class molecular chaperone
MDVCPDCNGKGEVVVKYSAKWIYERRNRYRFGYEECETCHGTGMVR